MEILSLCVLDDPQAAAELGKRSDEVVEGAVCSERILFPPTESGECLLADRGAVPARFDDLEVLVPLIAATTTFHPHEHEAILIEGLDYSSVNMARAGTAF